MLYKLEMLRKSVRKAIRGAHVDLLRGLDGAPGDVLLDVATRLVHVEEAASIAINEHEPKVDLESSGVVVLNEERKAALARDRRVLEEKIRQLHYRLEEKDRQIDQLKDHLHMAEGDLEAVRGMLKTRNGRESGLREEAAKWKHKAEEHQRLRGEEPKIVEELHKQVDDLRREVADYKDFLAHTLPLTDDRPELVRTFYGTIHEEPYTPEDTMIYAECCAAVDHILSTLTPREEKVLRMRFGIGERSDHTLEEVGQEFEVNRERVRQIEAKALRKLRHPSRSKYVKAFMWDPMPCWIDPGIHKYRWATLPPQVLAKQEGRKLKRKKRSSRKGKTR